MTPTSTLYATLVGGYAAVAVAAVLYLRRRSRSKYRWVGYCIVGVLVVSLLGVLSQFLEFGLYHPPGLEEGQQQSIPRFVDDMLAYGMLFGLMTWISGASGRLVALVGGLSVGSRIVIEIGAYLGGAVVLAAVLLSIGSYLARGYLLWGPAWRAAQRQHATRRLLFWKARNVLMFLMGMNIVSAILFGVVVPDAFVQLNLTQYVNVLIRVGFAGFVLVNLEALDRDRRASKTKPDPPAVQHE